jgi:hypothetical protein
MWALYCAFLTFLDLSMIFMDFHATFFVLLLMEYQNYSAAQPVPSSEEKDSAKPAESMTQSTPGIEDLFKDSPVVSLSSAPAVSQVNAKNDIMSLFEKVCTGTPFKTLFVKNGSI